MATEGQHPSTGAKYKNINVRIAKQDDLAGIVDIYNQAITAEQKTADISLISVKNKTNWFNEHKPEKYPILVAEIEGELVGYVSISPYRPGRMALRLTAEISYYVHFEHHYKGIGSRLIQKALDICQLIQIKTLVQSLLKPMNQVSGCWKNMDSQSGDIFQRLQNSMELKLVSFILS